MEDLSFVFGAVVVMVFSITTHEVAHGWVADRLGDPTARHMGRLTLNPLPHVDPFLTVFLPLAFFLTTGVAFGGAKPVPVNPRNLRHPIRDWALVGAAGPLTNLALGFLSCLLLAALLRAGAHAESPAAQTLAVAVTGNFVLATFNLLPIPPLDGSRVFQYFLPRSARDLYFYLERYGLWLVFALMMVGRPILFAYYQAVLWPLQEWSGQAAGGLFGTGGEVFHAFQALFRSSG